MRVDLSRVLIDLRLRSSSQPGADAFVGHPLTGLGTEILVQPSETGVVVCLALNGRRPFHSQYLLPEGIRLIP
jgi:hypothetical protein